jgi:acetyl-CoA acetyltransferase
MGGSSFVSHLFHVAAAVEAGLCEVALIAYGSTQRSASGRLVSGSETLTYEAPYRPRYPVSAYALAASRHMHEYGTTREQLAEVAVAAREWAKLNPKAFVRDDLSVEYVLRSRMVSSPLSVLDCCLVTDGGGAALVTSAERARSLRKPPVYLLGAGEAHWHRNISHMPDLTTSAAAESGPQAYQMASLGPKDMDVVMLYDAFTINTVLFLEDLGFCEKGEGGPFVSGGKISPGGELAVNTNGGDFPTTTRGCMGSCSSSRRYDSSGASAASARWRTRTRRLCTAAGAYSRARSPPSWARRRHCSPERTSSQASPVSLPLTS